MCIHDFFNILFAFLISNNWIEIINWVMVIAALIGTFFNSRRNKISQLIWSVTNLYMMWFNFHMGIFSIGTLYLAYFLLSVYGLYEWTRQEREEKNKDEDKKC